MNATPKGKTEGSRDLADMIAYDLNQHKKRSPALVVKEGEDVFNNSKKIPTKYFLNDQKKGNFEAVGYIDEPNAVVFVVMSSRSKSGFDNALPAFKEFIQNYQLISSKVENKKSNSR